MQRVILFLQADRRCIPSNRIAPSNRSPSRCSASCEQHLISGPSHRRPPKSDPYRPGAAGRAKIAGRDFDGRNLRGGAFHEQDVIGAGALIERVRDVDVAQFL
jgi:hypothetical protein